jgi:outer membrane immunogenic protein
MSFRTSASGRNLVALELSLASVFAIATPAFAADIPATAYKAAPAIVETHDWSGFYLGAHIGAGRGNSTGSFADPGNNAQFNCTPCFAPGFISPNIDQRDPGFLGGIHFGYNWQMAPAWLVGVEGDFAWTGISPSSNTRLTGIALAGAPFAVPGSNLNFQTDINWLASVRGRLGFVQSNWLVYATGGVAWADIDFGANATCAVTPGFIGCPAGFGVQAPVTLGMTRTGWVAGGGVEWQAPATRWRARAEYLYYAFDGTNTASTPWTHSGGGLAACAVLASCPANYGFGDVTVHTVRVGLSYRFD